MGKDGNLLNFLETYLKCTRDMSNTVDEHDAKEKATRLHTETIPDSLFLEDGFVTMLVTTNFHQIQKIFQKYLDLTGKSIQQAIKRSIFYGLSMVDSK